MPLLIFCFWTATVLTFLKNGLSCSRIKRCKLYLNMEELKHKVGLRVAKRIIILEAHLTFVLYFKILSVALSGLLLICNFF